MQIVFTEFLLSKKVILFLNKFVLTKNLVGLTMHFGN